MNLLRYQIVLLVHYILILYDLFANSFSELFSHVNVNLSVIYVLQDLCILFCILIFCLLLSSTFVFQADVILVTVCYLILSVSLHCWAAISRWNTPFEIPSSIGYHILFAFQRIWSVLYYFFYRRTIFRLGDYRYYEDSEWIKEQFTSNP
ncbi:Transmembrane protein 138 [Schistosoma japonicum]|nr:Transmembrane protein 138 [Schistosoma japonicum]